MTARFILSAAPALWLAQQAGADTFNGIYSQGDGAVCAPVAESQDVVRIEDGVFHGVQTECRMENPVDVRDMNAVLYDMQCEGDQTAWSARALFMTAADGGLIMVWDGYAFKYDPCPPDEAPAQGEDVAPVVTRNVDTTTPELETAAPAD